MKTEMTTTSVTLSGSPANTTKLASLLTLAAGAIAIPQATHADIIFTDLSSNPQSVGWSATDVFQLTLPGTAQFGFFRYQYSTSTTFGVANFRSVVGGRLGAGATVGIQVVPGGLVAHMNPGAPWDQGNLIRPQNTVAWAYTSGRSPVSGYDHEFMAWQFVDDSASGGGATRYGWVEVSLSTAFYPVGPTLTIWAYAWDNTGAKPFMGQTVAVPEPSSAALLVFGAMALGARGLRTWRKNRETIRNS